MKPSRGAPFFLLMNTSSRSHKQGDVPRSHLNPPEQSATVSRTQKKDDHFGMWIYTKMDRSFYSTALPRRRLLSSKNGTPRPSSLPPFP